MPRHVRLDECFLPTVRHDTERERIGSIESPWKAQPPVPDTDRSSRFPRLRCSLTEGGSCRSETATRRRRNRKRGWPLGRGVWEGYLSTGAALPVSLVSLLLRAHHRFATHPRI